MFLFQKVIFRQARHYPQHFVDMPTVPMIGGNHTPSKKTVMVEATLMIEATLQLIEASNLFEIEEVKRA